MKLVNRFLLIVLLFFSLFLIFFFAVSWSLILKSYVEMEDIEINKGMNRVISSINQEAKFLEDTVRDWAIWTDLYDFVEDGNQRFIESSLGFDTFVNLNINIIAVYDSSYSCVFSSSFDLHRGEGTDIHERFRDQGYIASILDSHNPVEEAGTITQNFLFIEDKPYIFSVHPSYKSYMEGDPNGYFLMAFCLDEGRLQNIAKNILVDFNIKAFGVREKDRFLSELGQIAEKNIYLKKTKETVMSSLIFQDISGETRFLLRAEFIRDLYLRGKSTIIYFFVLIASIGSLIILFTGLLLNRSIGRRLYSFSKDAELIGKDADLSGRIQVSGSDELTDLAHSINEMLELLQKKDALIEEDRSKYRNFVEMSKDGILILTDRLIKYASPAFLKMTGMILEDVIDTKITDYIVYDQMELAIYDPDSNLVREEFSSFETRIRSVSGEMIDVDISIGSLQYKGKTGNFAVIKDITVSKNAAKSLEKTKELLDITLSSLGIGVITTDVFSNILLINSRAEDIIGCRDQNVIGKPLDKVLIVVDKDTRKPYSDIVSSVINTRELYRYREKASLVDWEANLYFIDGICSPMYDHSGRIRGAVVAFRDITEEKHLQEEFIKIQKMDSISTLAGGIAHDFNNYLMGILGKISVAILQAELNPRTAELLYDVEKIIYHASDLVKKLIVFSKGGVPRKSLCNISDILQDAGLIALMGSNVSIHSDITEDLLAVSADRDLIMQALTNIMINSKEAMPKGGIIDIKVSNEKNPDIKSITDNRENFVKIDILDKGSGIPSEYILKVFDPYFTTKSTNLGLGLSIAYTIITSHGGHMALESKWGEWTRAVIHLPAEERLAGHIDTPPSKKASSIIRGSERILIMEDDENIRNILAEILNELGYRSDQAADGHEAFQKYKAEKEKNAPYDLVIMDLTIKGGMGGSEAIKLLLDFDPNARVIISSGYSNDSVISRFSEYGFRDALIKPYSVLEISNTIYRVLHLN